MSKNHIDSKQWYPVSIPLDASYEDMQRLIHVCGVLITARLTKNSMGNFLFEVFCADGEERAQAEALIHQAAVDDQLRQAIHRKSDPQISCLVENILNRASSG
jgi:hypothetical protein